MLRPVDTVRTCAYAPTSKPVEAAPGDRYEPGEEALPDLRAAARLLDSRLRLDKREVAYRLTSWAAAPDGTVYSAYAEEAGPRAYVASAAPDGAIRWELALAEGKVQRLDLLPNGNLLVGTETALTTLSPEGRLLGKEKGAVAGVWTDAKGSAYWLDAKDRRLHGSGLTGEVLDVRPTAEGGLLARTAEAVHRLAPGGALESTTPLPTFAKVKDTKHEVADGWALEGGDVLLQKRSTTTVWPPFHHGMEHDPMFGGGQMLRTPDITVRNTMVRTTPAGEALWESPDLGEKAAPVVLRDGSTYFVHGTDVKRVGPTGQAEVAFAVKQRVTDLLPGEGGTLLVRAGDTVTRRAPTGEVLAKATARPGMTLRGDAPGGLFVFAEEEGVLWSCDPRDGTWTRRTDPVGDHSVALTVENLKSQEAPPPEVREEDEWIAIGGIRLEKRS